MSSISVHFKDENYGAHIGCLDVIPLEGPRTIRLVELHPAIDFNSPIECTIRSASLSNWQYQYRALSYVWGVDKSLPKAIFSGQPITISAMTFVAVT
jgi:hypothetical protein